MEEEEDLEQFYFEKEQEDQVRDEFFAVEEAQNAFSALYRLLPIEKKIPDLKKSLKLDFFVPPIFGKKSLILGSLILDSGCNKKFFWLQIVIKQAYQGYS